MKSASTQTLAVLLFLQTCNAFLVSPRSRIFTTSQLHVASSIPPPIEQVKVAPSTTVTGAVSQATSTTNLPSQKDLAEKVGSKSQAAAPAPKSTNVASGSGISISDIHYNGDVPRTEADEYIVISNKSREPIDVSGYYMYVATTGTQGPTFHFPKGTVIKGGSSVRVYTNEIHKESGGYSFGSGKAIWSNNGGLGVIKDSKGKKLDEYKYKPN